MTGFAQEAMEEMQDWKVVMCWSRMCARRAGSRVGGKEEGERRVGEEMSRPVVKARGEVEVRIMARVEGEVERWVKIAESSCHILGVGKFGFGLWWRKGDEGWDEGEGRGAYGSIKAFIFSGRFISTRAT